MNKPDDFDCWRLPDDDSVQKVTLTADTKVANAMTMIIEREDHTLGNILRMCAPPPPSRRERAAAKNIFSRFALTCKPVLLPRAGKCSTTPR